MKRLVFVLLILSLLLCACGSGSPDNVAPPELTSYLESSSDFPSEDAEIRNILPDGSTVSSMKLSDGTPHMIAYIRGADHLDDFGSYFYDVMLLCDSLFGEEYSFDLNWSENEDVGGVKLMWHYSAPASDFGTLIDSRSGTDEIHNFKSLDEIQTVFPEFDVKEQ